MRACIVWRCNGATASSSGLCSRHEDAPRPYGPDALRVADLTDPDSVQRDSDRHNGLLDGGRIVTAWTDGPQHA